MQHVNLTTPSTRSEKGSVANLLQEVQKGPLPLAVRRLGRQGGELFGWCQTWCPLLTHSLPFLEPMHELNSGEGILRRVEGREPQHGTRDPLDRSMVLCHHMIHILHLADDDVGTVGLMVAFDGRFIRPTPINGDRLGDPVAVDRLRQKAPRGLDISVLREQNVKGLPSLIDRSVHVPPLAFHPEIGLIHPPAAAHGALAAVERLCQLRTVRHDPALERRVVDWYPARLHQFFDMPITQGVRTYHRTPIKIIACGKWAPLKRTGIVWGFCQNSRHPSM